MYKYIGIVGYAGSGKDTLAEMIREHHPEYINFKFAGKLKEFCSELFDIPMEVFESQEKKSKLGFYQFKSTEEYVDKYYKVCESVLGITDRHVAEYLASVTTKEISVENRTDNTTMTFKTSPREILQKIGTDVFRDHYSDTIWVGTIDRADKAIVTDVRFPNEAEKIKESGGILVRIINVKQKDQEIMNHPSEKHIEDIECDYVIYNNGDSLEKLKQQTTKFMGAFPLG